MLRDQAEALAVLEAWALNPTAGLPYELFLFISRLVPMTNVDLLVYDDEGRILLTWRDEPIHGVGWHVPGGMIRYKETAEDRVRATALEELGLESNLRDRPLSSRSLSRSAEFAVTISRCCTSVACSPHPVRRFVSPMESRGPASGRGTRAAPKT
jgi:colanic acid biosynthesis protein WcaH